MCIICNAYDKLKNNNNECNYRAKRVVFRTNPINMAGYQLHYNTPKVNEEPWGRQRYLLSQLYSGLQRKIRLIYYPLTAGCGRVAKNPGRNFYSALYVTEKRIQYARHESGGDSEMYVCLLILSHLLQFFPKGSKRELAERGSAYMPRQRYHSKPTAHTHTHKDIYIDIDAHIYKARLISMRKRKQEIQPTLRSVL